MGVSLHAVIDAPDAPDVAFSSGIIALGTEIGWSGSMAAEEFAALVEEALDRLYHSNAWGEYIVSGQLAEDRRSIDAGLGAVYFRGHPAALEGALLAGRKVASYAHAHGVPVAWH